MERFQKIYHQGTIDVVEIWVDTQTGVNYVFHRNGNAAGFTPLLDKDGKPVVSQQCYNSCLTTSYPYTQSSQSQD